MYIQQEMENTPGLEVEEGTVEDLIVSTDDMSEPFRRTCNGITLHSGKKIISKAVILTTGKTSRKFY